MPLTFGLTGMDPATERSLKAAFTEANERLGGAWQLLPETQAAYVVVDMDSLYGPMSWLRLHAAGKTVVGLTSAPRTQADNHLMQPFDAHSVSRLLQELASRSGQPGAPGAEAAATGPDTRHPAGLTPAPQPQDLLPEEQPMPGDEEEVAPAEPTAVAASRDALVATDAREPPSAAAGKIVPPAPNIEPRVPPAAAPVAKEPSSLIEWLASGRLKGRVRFEREGEPLLIDLDRREYFGPPLLKPLTAHMKGAVTAEDFQPIEDEAKWKSETAAFGEAQPLMRLVWFGNLRDGEGKLVDGFDPEARFQMLKWPQTEREYPKHFRIATAMMKGPATLAEIAEASGVPVPDVTDFVNANLATGFADVEHIPEPEPEPTKSTSLFGRLRGR